MSKQVKISMKGFLVLLLICLWVQSGRSQDLVFRPDRVFDGESVHVGWVVAVDGDRILYAGPPSGFAAGPQARVVDMPGLTLSPGMIEGHSHVLLHPYDEAAWNDQVLKESRALRVARATNHVRNTLYAGFTTIRDLGTEGAEYADIGIKQAIIQEIIPGPRMIVAGRAIVATGSYGPKGFHPEVDVPLGAEEADGVDDLIRVVRTQIGKGVDVVKIYADYRWGPHGEAMPTFSEDEIRLVVRTASASGRPVVAHAATEQGMLNAIMGGVSTIEHGDGATDRVLDLMAARGIPLLPTLAAVEATSMYAGWEKGVDPEPPRITEKKKLIKRALEKGVIIGMGSDVGVFTHGRNAWELELMVEYGMSALQTMRATTSVNASILGLPDRGRIEKGLLADLIATEGDPTEDISAATRVQWVVKGGKIAKKPE